MRALLLVLCTGCSGLTLDTGDLIAANWTNCLHDVHGDQDAYQDWLLGRFVRRSIDIEEWGRDHSTAWATVLNVPRGFWDWETDKQNRTLGHEWVHYCQRSKISNFDGRYPDPIFQAKIETPAYRQTARVKNVQGASCKHLRSWTRTLPDRMGSAPYTMGLIENLDVVIPIVWQESEERCGDGP